MIGLEKLEKKLKQYRRWKRRMERRNPKLAGWIPIMEFGIPVLLALLLVVVITLIVRSGQETPAFAGRDQVIVPMVTREPEPTPDGTPVPTAEPTPSPTPEPVYIDGVLEDHFYQTAAPGQSYSDPAQNKLVKYKVYVNGGEEKNYARADEIHMPPSSQYTELEGITTFRGSNYRDGGAYGTIPENPTGLSIMWEQKIGRLDEWTGVGWTGQASAVRWPDELKQIMNIRDDKKNKNGLIEAIYGTLDGHIYFFDLEDGQPTRSPINIGASIKGSVSIDPRGLPLLYCGQGIYEVHGERVKCGTRIWSLIDQKLLYMINGDDDYALRKWRAFDCAPLVSAETDTLLQAGENGVLYSVDLNTNFDGTNISIDPKMTRYVYDHSLSGQVGTESSITAYNNYVYMSNNSGVIQCVDVNTMKPVWCVNAEDDIDASMSLEVEEDGDVYLYVANELDKRGGKGHSQMYKVNALTGELIWKKDSGYINHSDENGGGSFATPAIGKNSLSSLVYYSVARIGGGGGTLYALDKETGKSVWEYDLGRYGWSSPTCVYTESGKGYLIVGNSRGLLRLFDGETGQVIHTAQLDGNIEGTPIVFDDMLVVGTRDSRVYGIKIV